MRLLPQHPLPPYSYVPGRFPHPVSDPAGHRMDTPLCDPATSAPERWLECAPYLFGIDCFNQGFYWEAHECWETVWHAVGRRGRQADFLKSLIKLAAALVKAKEGRSAGVLRHSLRAAELLKSLQSDACTHCMGLSLLELTAIAEQIATSPSQFMHEGDEVVPLLDRQLVPAVR